MSSTADRFRDPVPAPPGEWVPLHTIAGPDDPMLEYADKDWKFVRGPVKDRVALVYDRSRHPMWGRQYYLATRYGSARAGRSHVSLADAVRALYQPHLPRFRSRRP